jgi:hypothetical protein
MAQADENAVVVDQVEVILGNVAKLRTKLLALRQSNGKEYDRVLKQSFPLDALTLIEMLSVECGNRTALLAARFDELADAVLSDEDEGEGEGDIGMSVEEGEAVAVLVAYLKDKPDLPDSVKAAIALLEESEGEAEDEGEAEGEDEGAGGVEAAVAGVNAPAGASVLDGAELTDDSVGGFVPQQEANDAGQAVDDTGAASAGESESPK